MEWEVVPHLVRSESDCVELVNSLIPVKSHRPGDLLGKTFLNYKFNFLKSIRAIQIIYFIVGEL